MTVTNSVTQKSSSSSNNHRIVVSATETAKEAYVRKSSSFGTRCHTWRAWVSFGWTATLAPSIFVSKSPLQVALKEIINK